MCAWTKGGALFKKHKWVLGFIVATLLTLLSIGVSLSADPAGTYVTAVHLTSP